MSAMGPSAGASLRTAGAGADILLESEQDPSPPVTPSRRLAVAGTERLTVESVAALLGTRTSHRVVAAIDSLGDAAAAAALSHAEMLVVVTPATPGIPAMIEELRVARPGMSVVVLCTRGGSHLVGDALAAGVRGYVSEGQSAHELVRVVDAVARGEVAVDIAVMTAAVRRHLAPRSTSAPVPVSELTEREKHVLMRLVEARTTSEIASELGVSLHTARAHIQRVLVKLGVHSRVDAAAVAAARDPGYWVG